jgi:tripartite-type tricarboxylate transporter receptor subunit TctC
MKRCLNVPLVLLAVSVSASAQAADRYPSRTVKLVVAFAPGGVADIMGRLIGCRSCRTCRR